MFMAMSKKRRIIFKCFSFNKEIQLLDSNILSLKKHKPSDLLEITTDTLHDVINFYFQFIDKNNEFMLLRLNDSLKTICYVEKTEANKMNAFAAFDDEKYYTKNHLYVIKSNVDSTEKQFYLNKYQVKSISKPFEYEMNWQFPFERENIHRASVVYADAKHVFVNAHLNDGPKKGQWILCIDAKNGKLKKASRLGSKLTNKHYLYSNSIYDKKQICFIY